MLTKLIEREPHWLMIKIEILSVISIVPISLFMRETTDKHKYISMIETSCVSIWCGRKDYPKGYFQAYIHTLTPHASSAMNNYYQHHGHNYNTWETQCVNQQLACVCLSAWITFLFKVFDDGCVIKGYISLIVVNYFIIKYIHFSIVFVLSQIISVKLYSFRVWRCDRGVKIYT